MKAILEFNMDDAEDIQAHLRCVKATDMALVLWELYYNSKKTLENELEDKDIDSFETLDLVFSRFNSLLEEHDINPDKLIT
jgi:hypothetical protein